MKNPSKALQSMISPTQHPTWRPLATQNHIRYQRFAPFPASQEYASLPPAFDFQEATQYMACQSAFYTAQLESGLLTDARHIQLPRHARDRNHLRKGR